MKEEDIRRIVSRQRAFFETGATLPVAYRLEALKRLKNSLTKHEKALHDALHADLGKSASEGYMCEVGLVQSELRYMIRHTRSFARERRVHTPLSHFCSRSFVKPSPYGTALIMSPWNYPVLLTLDPLTNAIAAGNTAVLKPSAYSPHTAAVLESITAECFPPEYVAVITGGRQENACLLNERFDTIFFTGSGAVGKEVMRKAAEHLTPVTLELGGKSPCIVDKTANLELAARRIVFGKYLNCGQTCVAPDYLYCDETVKERLTAAIQKEIVRQFGPDPLGNPHYGRIINDKHFARLCGLLDKTKIVCGGEVHPDTLRIAPTVMDGVSFDDAVMQEEIFGPILPVLTFRDMEEAIAKVNSLPHPLALYLFSSDRKVIRTVTSRCAFGGGCINDTIIHLATSGMGFGGVGASGMGAYHGKAGFDTFSHHKSIVDKKTWIDLPMRYQPYSDRNDRMIRFFLK